MRATTVCLLVASILPGPALGAPAPSHHGPAPGPASAKLAVPAPRNATDVARSLKSAPNNPVCGGPSEVRDSRQCFGIELIRDEALRYVKLDGGNLSEAHRAYLQAKLDDLLRPRAHR